MFLIWLAITTNTALVLVIYVKKLQYQYDQCDNLDFNIFGEVHSLLGV